MERAPLVVMYDGECPLCIGWVRWLVKRDTGGRLRFAALDGEWARQMRGRIDGLTAESADAAEETVRVWDAERLLERSEAVLAVLAELPRPWRLARHLRVLPLQWRDHVYRLVARNRYNWFGRRESCWMPGPAERSRFLDSACPPNGRAG